MNRTKRRERSDEVKGRRFHHHLWAFLAQYAARNPAFLQCDEKNTITMPKLIVGVGRVAKAEGQEYNTEAMVKNIQRAATAHLLDNRGEDGYSLEPHLGYMMLKRYMDHPDPRKPDPNFTAELDEISVEKYGRPYNRDQKVVNECKSVVLDCSYANRKWDVPDAAGANNDGDEDNESERTTTMEEQKQEAPAVEVAPIETAMEDHEDHGQQGEKEDQYGWLYSPQMANIMGLLRRLRASKCGHLWVVELWQILDWFFDKLRDVPGDIEGIDPQSSLSRPRQALTLLLERDAMHEYFESAKTMTLEQIFQMVQSKKYEGPSLERMLEVRYRHKLLGQQDLEPPKALEAPKPVVVEAKVVEAKVASAEAEVSKPNPPYKCFKNASRTVLDGFFSWYKKDPNRLGAKITDYKSLKSVLPDMANNMPPKSLHSTLDQALYSLVTGERLLKTDKPLGAGYTWVDSDQFGLTDRGAEYGWWAQLRAQKKLPVSFAGFNMEHPISVGSPREPWADGFPLSAKGPVTMDDDDDDGGDDSSTSETTKTGK